MKSKINIKKIKAFTLTEQIMAMLMSGIIVLGMGAILVGSQEGWSRMYTRVYGDVVTGGYITQRTFESVVRKSTAKRATINNSEITVYYYNDPSTSTVIDRYARFYKSSASLLVDYGTLDDQGDPDVILQTVTLADNVEALSFSVCGSSVGMILKINNGSEAITVLSSAYRHSN